MKHKTLRGVLVDMSAYAAANAEQIAVGNASMNASGDIIGPGGKVIKTREQIIIDNKFSQRSVRKVPLKDLEKELFQSPAEALNTAKKEEGQKKETKTKRKLSDSE